LSKSPEIQKENVVAQRLMDEEILSDSEEGLTEKLNNFQKYLKIYAELDDELCRVYDGSQGNSVPTGLSWFGNDNVMNSFFAAIADFGSTEQRTERIDKSLVALLKMLKEANNTQDPLGLASFYKITNAIPVRKVNVGFGTRKLLTSAFKEYFREEGEKPLSELWAIEAE
jgi:hypothetical protein